MKKLLSVILTCALLVGILPLYTAADDTESVLYTIKGTFRDGGKYLDIAIEMENNTHGLWAAVLFLDYNEALLSPVGKSIKNGDVWEWAMATIDLAVIEEHPHEWLNNTIYMSYTGNDIVNATNVESGTLCTLTFEVINHHSTCESNDVSDFGFALKTMCENKEWKHEPNNHGRIDPSTVEFVAVPFEYVVDVPNHLDVEVTPGVESTCQTHGYTESRKCNACGKVFMESEELPLAEHTPLLWTVNTLPTQTVEGNLCSYCAVCGTHFEKSFKLPEGHYNIFINDYYYDHYKAGEEFYYSTPRLLYFPEDRSALIYIGSLLIEMDAISFDHEFSFTMPEYDLNILSAYAIHGDVNMDDRVTALDVLSFLKSVKSGEVYPEHDINLDGKVTALDKLALYQILKGTFNYESYLY